MIGSHRIARDADRSRRAETTEPWKITRSPTPGCMLARASNLVVTMAFRDRAPLPPHNLLAHLGRATAVQGDPTGSVAACEFKGAAVTPTEFVAYRKSGIERDQRQRSLIKSKCTSRLGVDVRCAALQSCW